MFGHRGMFKLVFRLVIIEKNAKLRLGAVPEAYLCTHTPRVRVNTDNIKLIRYIIYKQKIKCFQIDQHYQPPPPQYDQNHHNDQNGYQNNQESDNGHYDGGENQYGDGHGYHQNHHGGYDHYQTNQKPQVSNQYPQQSNQQPQVSNQKPQVSNQRPQYSNQGGPNNPYWHGHKQNGGHYTGQGQSFKSSPRRRY